MSHYIGYLQAQILAQYKPKINTTDLVDSLKQVEGTARHALEMFKSTRHIVLYYEDIVSNHTVSKLNINSFFSTNSRLPLKSLVHAETCRCSRVSKGAI